MVHNIISRYFVHNLEKIASVLTCTPAELTGWTAQPHSTTHEEPSPYLTEEEIRLLEAWHQATDKERAIIAMLLQEYGMPIREV